MAFSIKEGIGGASKCVLPFGDENTCSKIIFDKVSDEVTRAEALHLSDALSGEHDSTNNSRARSNSMNNKQTATQTSINMLVSAYLLSATIESSISATTLVADLTSLIRHLLLDGKGSWNEALRQIFKGGLLRANELSSYCKSYAWLQNEARLEALEQEKSWLKGGKGGKRSKKSKSKAKSMATTGERRAKQSKVVIYRARRLKKKSNAI